MGNNLLPARAGEALRVFLLSGQVGGRSRKVVGTVIAERILDAAVLAVALAVVLFTFLPDRARPSNLPVLIADRRRGGRASRPVALRVAGRRGLLARVREFARPLAEAPKALLGPGALPLLAMTVAIWALEAGVFAASARALDVTLDAVQATYLVGLANLFAALPAAPGSIGTFEAAVLFGLSAISIGAKSVSYLLLLRLVLYGPITLSVSSFCLLATEVGSSLRERRRSTGRWRRSRRSPSARRLPGLTAE